MVKRKGRIRSQTPVTRAQAIDAALHFRRKAEYYSSRYTVAMWLNVVQAITLIVGVFIYVF